MVSVSREGYTCGEYVGKWAPGSNTQTPDSVSAPTTLWRGSKTGVSSAYSLGRPPFVPVQGTRRHPTSAAAAAGVP
jgi:hypothetical protein